jgi:hypothetical protein
MLGYPTAFMAYMFVVNGRVPARNAAAAAYRWLVPTFLFIYIFAVPATRTAAQQAHLPFKTGGVADLSSRGPQSRRGDLYIADDDVDIRYGDSRLRADHVEYNEKTSCGGGRSALQR